MKVNKIEFVYVALLVFIEFPHSLLIFICFAVDCH